MDTILKRRSQRAYSEKDVPEDVLRQVVNAGLNAPSAMNQQPWRIYVVRNKQFLRDLGCKITENDMKQGKKDGVFYGSPACIMITVAKTGLPAPAAASIDIGLCAENMLLACQALGLAAVPVLISKIYGEKEIMEFLKADTTKEELALTIPIGYPKTAEATGPKNVDEKAKVVWL